MPKDNRTNILPPRPPPFETRMQNKVRKNANVRCLMDEIGICLIRTHCSANHQQTICDLLFPFVAKSTDKHLIYP